MSDSSAYEAAVEIREALRDVTNALDRLPGERAILATLLLGAAILKSGPELDIVAIRRAVQLADVILQTVAEEPTYDELVDLSTVP